MRRSLLSVQRMPQVYRGKLMSTTSYYVVVSYLDVMYHAGFWTLQECRAYYARQQARIGRSANWWPSDYVPLQKKEASHA